MRFKMGRPVFIVDRRQCQDEKLERKQATANQMKWRYVLKHVKRMKDKMIFALMWYTFEKKL